MRKFAFALAAPLLALAFAFLVTTIILIVSGHPPIDTYKQMWDYGIQPDSLSLTLNLSTTYYLAAIAVAIGFKMNLFNIGVDGQYRLAALFAAYVGGQISLPPVLHVTVIIATAMIVGALWAGVAAVLKNRRGVSEVISTIMLNYVATGIIAFLLTEGRFGVLAEGSNNIGTPTIPDSGHVPGIPLIPDAFDPVYGLIFLAAAVGIGYWWMLNRTRFGFDLRATGLSPTAAAASGINGKRMVLFVMLLSGALAGLIGMPQLLGVSMTYNLDFPAGLGFTGIAIALLGRNSPIGIVFGALLWAFLDSSRQILDLTGVSKEIVTIMQGVAVLSVVVAYELVRRYSIRAQQREVGRQLAAETPMAEAAA
ncbi:MAG: ABC transporter permease [Frankiales bacterium]|nr:ABC transporter permease [Frankiales bacterium]